MRTAYRASLNREFLSTRVDLSNCLDKFEYLTRSEDGGRQGAMGFVDKGETILGKEAAAVTRLADLEAIETIARADNLAQARRHE